MSSCRLHSSPLTDSSVNFHVGQYVAALFSDDQSWYRAQILSQLQEDGTYNVLFVDYGNCSSVQRSDIVSLKEEFFDVPVQAVRCILGDGSQ